MYMIRWLLLLALAPVVRSTDEAIYRMNLYPVNTAVRFVNTYLLDRGLPVEQPYPVFRNWTLDLRAQIT